MNNNKSRETIIIMYPSRKGGVAEVCLSLKAGFQKLGYEVLEINSLVTALVFSVKNIFTSNQYMLISNLHFGIFGMFFKQSIFIIHGFPQRKYEKPGKYLYVVWGHKIFALCNRKSVAVSYLTRFVSENFYNIKVDAVIHNILPFDFFEEALKHPSVKQPDTLTFVGRVIKEKGVDKILEAINLIRHTGKKVIVNIVGSGNFIAQLKETYAHPDNIFYGYLSSEDKYIILARSTSFISLHPAEPFGITALEASALGVHCCLSAVGGHTEFVPHEILFPINNVEDISQIAKAIAESLITSSNSLISNTKLLDENEYLKQYAQEFLTVFKTI